MGKKKMREGIVYDPLSEHNFREFAQRAIKKYEEKNMVIDAILWAQIIGYYEVALKKAK